MLPRSPRVTAVAVVLSFLAAVSPAASLPGSSAEAASSKKKSATSESKRQQAERIQNQLDELYDEMSSLAEDANDAKVRLAAAEVEVQESAASAKETTAEYERRLEGVKRRARNQYVRGQGSALKFSATLAENKRRSVYLALAQGTEIDTVDSLSAAKEDVEREKTRATKAAKRAATERKRAKDALSSAEQLAIKQERLLKSVQADVARLLVVEEQQRVEAEAKRAIAAEKKRKKEAAAELALRKKKRAEEDALALQAQGKKKNPQLADRVAPTTARASSPENDDAAQTQAPAPAVVRDLSDQELAVEAGQAATAPSSPGAATAVAVAKQQLGKSYVWGAEGTLTFDCSGLTLYAWRAAGVNLPHSSRVQYSITRRISKDQLQPGDLLFFAKPGRPIHHVSMYIGNGEMIEAPHRGAKVRIRPANRRDYVGAGRVK